MIKDDHYIFSGRVMWSFGYEVLQRNTINDVAYQFSGVKPYHDHFGTITLNKQAIVINGSIDLYLPLKDIIQLYLGFDEVYPAGLTKNFGLFWQPLRITLYNGTALYLVIDYNYFSSGNKKWFNTLVNIL